MPVWYLKTASHSAERFSTSGCVTMAFKKVDKLHMVDCLFRLLMVQFFWSADPHQVGSAGTQETL